jgi:catechol 2,3-dioxygenase-like lactoylglutathione lyase family enzyme
MSIQSANLTLITEKLPATRKFYEQHFDARPLFDCGWYVVLRLGHKGAPELCLMEPQPGMQPFAGGVFINLEVDNVDHLHSQLTEAGLKTAVPLEDHPWGDRGFGLPDPSGAMVYCYQSIEPAAEFKQYFVNAD